MSEDSETINEFRFAMAIFDKEPKKSKKILEKILETDPEFYQVLYNLGNIYSDEGNIEKSKDMYEKAYKINKNPNILYNLSNQNFKLGFYEDAINGFEEVLKLEEDNYSSTDCLYNLAFSYMKAEKYDEAIQRFYGVTYLDDVNMDAWFNIAVCQYSMGNKKDSIQTFLHILKLVPDNYHVYYNLALIYMELEMYSKAVTYFKKYLDLPNKLADQVEYIKFARRKIREYEERI